MYVLVVHNAMGARATAADRDVLDQVAAVSNALRCTGCTVDTRAVSLNLDELHKALNSLRPDVVFNLVESLAGYDRLAPLAASLFEVLGYRHTGAAAETLGSLSDKVRAKERLRWAGLPTPDWVLPGGPFPSSPGDSRTPAGRYIIKPIHDHASYGIDADSVLPAVDRRTVLAALAERERRLARPCFAERFIEGREFNLSVLAGPGGPEVLPPAEIVFVGFPADEPRIVNYAAKWEPDSFAYRNTPRRFNFPDSDRALLEELRELAGACWHLFGLRGYARVDFRVDAHGRSWILEVNANPCLSPDAGFAAAVERAGYSFRDAVDRIVVDARGEYPRAAGVHASACQKSRAGVHASARKASHVVGSHAEA